MSPITICERAAGRIHHPFRPRNRLKQAGLMNATSMTASLWRASLIALSYCRKKEPPSGVTVFFGRHRDVLRALRLTPPSSKLRLPFITLCNWRDILRQQHAMLAGNIRVGIHWGAQGFSPIAWAANVGSERLPV